jgi:putative FmdB family regulatory protein
MPIYEFSCKYCGFIFERLCRGDEKSEKCPGCGHRAKKMMSVATALFIGPGFYATDYKKPRGRVHEDRED